MYLYVTDIYIHSVHVQSKQKQMCDGGGGGVGRVLLLLRWRRSAAPKTGKTGSTAPKTEKTGSRGALAPGFQNQKKPGKTGKNRETGNNWEPPQKLGLPVKPGG